MSFYSDQAAQFQTQAESIQARMDGAGTSMDPVTHGQLQQQHDQLLAKAAAMLADDVLATLEGLNLDKPRLDACTKSLNQAVKNVKTFNDVVCIGEAALTLATACVSCNPEAIVSALAGAEKAVQGAVQDKVITIPAAVTNSPLGKVAGKITSLAASGDDAASGGDKDAANG